jgi:hypothetical protein
MCDGEASKLEWEGHVIRRDEGELVKNIVE